MEPKKLLFVLGIPTAGILIVVAALAIRNRVQAPSLGETSRKKEIPQPSGTLFVPAQPPPRPVPAPEKTVATQSEVVRIRSTYQNYRTAVATENVTLARALLPVLTRDREVAVRLAEEDLARASSSFDRSVAGRVLESLRR